MVLARIAASHKRTEDLALFFSYWHHVVHVHDLGWLRDDESPWPRRPVAGVRRDGCRAPMGVEDKEGGAQ
jgi:hypothetical protein